LKMPKWTENQMDMSFLIDTFFDLIEADKKE
jgi:hypothetical protein